MDSDGNIYFAGYTDATGAGGYDALLIKFNNCGIEQWNRTWGGVNDEFCWGFTLDALDNIQNLSIEPRRTVHI